VAALPDFCDEIRSRGLACKNEGEFDTLGHLFGAIPVVPLG
jgi:hypothetical protein